MAKISFDSLLANDRLESDLWLFKSAQSQADDTQFETDFSNLAFTFIQDRAPALMNYILGFETVDRSEDGTRAVGIFGFKIDDDYYYVPAFFLNNQVKGVESILAKRTNSFIPLTEEWINFIINRRATEIGKPSEERSDEENFENPNFDFLRRPTVGPLGGGRYYKDASAKGSEGPAWNGGLRFFKDDGNPWTLKQAWDVIRYRVADGLAKDAGFREAAAGLHGALTGRRSLFKVASDEHGPITEYLRLVGGPSATKTLFDALGGSVKFANAAMEFYGSLRDLAPKSFPSTNWAVKRAQEAAILEMVHVTFTDHPKEEDEATAKQVLEDGFTVVDRRDDDHASYTVRADYEKMFQTPDAPGVYDVLCSGGMTHRAYVLDLDRTCNNGAKGGSIVYFPDNNQTIVCRKRWVIANGGRKESSKDIYGDGDSLGSVRNGGKYVFIGPDGSCIGVVEVYSSHREDGGRVVLDASVHDSISWESDYLDREAGLSDSSYMWTIPFSTIELADFDGRPVTHGSTLVMPRNWKVLDVTEKPRPERRDGEPWDEYDARVRAETAPVHKLGSFASLTADLRKQGAAELEVASDGADYNYRFDGMRYSAPMTYKQAAVDLVTRLGLRWTDAREMLKEAAVERRSRRLVKMGQLVGVDPMMPVDQTPSSDEYTGIPTYQTPYSDETTAQFNNVPYVDKDNVYGENLDGEMARDQEAAFDPEAQQLAQDAAAAGQKNVFDQAAIGGLAKVYDVGAVVDSYLPEFMQAIDRLGRVMFLYYWKHDDFVERYGTDQVVEMEDVLRSTFKQLGKLTLDLRNKAVGQGDATVVA